MKKLLTALLMTASSASFAGTTATLLLKGTIQQILDISVSADTVASTLDLTTTQAATRVARVTEKSNSNSGYKVTISSANLGKLKNGAAVFNYTLSYNGSALNLAAPVVQTNSAAAAVTVQKDVNISYTGVPQDQLVAGDYTDTVTFTIAAN
jgi:hypothetical protein